MIIYIHGFASSGMGDKDQVFRQYFKACSIDVFAPSLPKAHTILEDGGNHRFQHIERHFERIQRFLLDEI
ncbi:MAG: hypothetical protein IBX55_15225 [Methyloprofundus sp.]|nr:hypothetical protein [Methyloprofundus sp.]